MSDSVLMPQTPPALFSALATNAAPLVLTDVPAELTRLPVGTVLTADVVTYTETQNACVLNVALPDGSTVAFQTNAVFPESLGNAVSFKILPNDGPADTLSIRLMPPKTQADAPQPQTKAAPTARVSDVVVQNAPVVSGRVLQNIPPQLDLSLFDAPSPDALPKGAQLELRLIAAVPPADAAPLHLSANNAAPTPQTIGLPTVEISDSNTPSAPSVLQTQMSAPDSLPTQPAASENAPATPAATTAPLSAAPLPQTPDAAPLHQPTNNAPAPPTAPTAEKSAPVSTPPPPVTESAQTMPFAAAPHPATVPNAPAVLPEAPENVSLPSQTTPDKPAVVSAEIKGVFVQPKASEPPLIVSEAGVIALNEKISVPHLSTLTLKVVSITPPEIPVPDFSSAKENASPWRVLNEAIAALERVDAPAVDTLKAVLAQTGNKMPALMLNYLNAVNTGADVRAWLGEANVQALESLGRRGQAVLKQLEKEFSAGPKKMSDGKSVWKGYDIPFMTGTAVEPVSLYLQQSSEALEERAKNKSAPVTAVRFVLDLNLTKLGRVQLEGLSQRAKRSFNLNIRHTYPLDAAFEDRVRTLFTKTLDALNYTGVVAVKRTDDFIEIREEPASPAQKDGGLWA